MLHGCKISELFEIKNHLLSELFSVAEYPWDILPRINKFLTALIENKPNGFSEYSESVLIGKNVKLGTGVEIHGPTVICDGTELRHNAFIRGNAFIGCGCVIGNSTEVKNSVLLDGAQAPHYNYIGDSVIGSYAHLGAGVICSNLRSDKRNADIKLKACRYPTGLRKVGAFVGDGAEIGCGCVLNPATVIPKYSTVSPLSSIAGYYIK